MAGLKIEFEIEEHRCLFVWAEAGTDNGIMSECIYRCKCGGWFTVTVQDEVRKRLPFKIQGAYPPKDESI